MKYSFFPFFIISVVAIAGKWSLASKIDDHVIQKQIADRTLQTALSTGDNTCSSVCDNVDDLSLTVQVVEVENEDESLFSTIFTRMNDSIDSGSRLGRLINGLFNLFRFRPSYKPRYEISTDLLLSALSNYSAKAKSLAALIRSESVSYANASDTPNVVASMFEWSAENMESVVTVIDPIVEKLRQSETIDLATVSCSIGGLLTHLRDETLTHVVSIAEFIYTKSGNSDMEEMYGNYRNAQTTIPLESSSATDVNVNHQCFELATSGTTSKTSELEGSISTHTRIFEDASFLSMDRQPLLEIVGLIILFPLSFIVSIASIIFGPFVIVILVIIEGLTVPNDPPSNVDCSENPVCGIYDDFPWRLFILLLLVASPILIPIGIVASSIEFLQMLSGPIQSSDQVSEQTRDVMQHLKLLLESPMENMVDNLKRLYYRDEADEVEMDLDCDVKTIMCQNDALMASLPI